jgi:hypothetical protein
VAGDGDDDGVVDRLPEGVAVSEEPDLDRKKIINGMAIVPTTATMVPVIHWLRGFCVDDGTMAS